MIEQGKALHLLAGRIRELRRKKGLTLEKLAYENDISKGNLSDIENEKRSPSFYTLVKLANGLECRVKELLDF
jgi:transcriptional regulator with XRE-family HTH domain